MEQKEENFQQMIQDYVSKLDEVIEVLIGVPPQYPETWNEAMLTAIRYAYEVKCYLKNLLDEMQ